MINETFEALKTNLLRLQQKRKMAAVGQKLMWGLTGLFFVFMLVQLVWPITDLSLMSNIAVIGIGFIVVMQGIVFYFLKLHKAFKEEEHSIIEKMTGRLFPDFKFHSTHYLPEQELTRSRLFESETIASSYYGLLSGKVDHAQLYIADIGLIQHDTKNKFQNLFLRIPYLSLLVILYEYVLKNIFTNKSADTVHHSFRGIFCWTNFNKRINGLTVVLPDKLEARFGSLAKTIQGLSRRGQLVNLEDPRFENEFVVYSTDQVEARYILSASMMEKLYELKQKFNHPIMLSFYQNKIYMAVHLEHGLLSFRPEDLTSSKSVENIYSHVNLVKQMVYDLKLNDTLHHVPVVN